MVFNREDARCLWTFDIQGIIYLNHGSFGAPSKPVREVLATLQAYMNENPMVFFTHPDYHGGRLYEKNVGLLERNRRFMAKVLGSTSSNLVLTPNTTDGQNAVVSSLVRAGHFKAKGDHPREILRTSFGYNATNNILAQAAHDTDAIIRVAQLPFPLESKEQAVTLICAEITENTALVVIDAISSDQACLLPYEDVIKFCRAHNVPVLLDAAHIAGHVPINLSQLKPDFATFSGHKWMCAAEGSGALYVDPQWQDIVHPTCISHGANAVLDKGLSRFECQFAWNGTNGNLANLTLETAWQTLCGLSSAGIWDVVAQNSIMLQQGASFILDLLGIEANRLMPDDLCAPLLKTIPLGRQENVSDIKKILWKEHKIITQMNNGLPGGEAMIRLSAAPYNTLAHYERVAHALKVVLS